MTNSELQDKLAEAMAKARIDANKSQSDMASLLGVKFQTIQNWEYGHTRPSFVYVYRWFEVLRKNIHCYLEDDKEILAAITEAAASLDVEIQKKLLMLLHDDDRDNIINYVDLGRNTFK